MKNTQMVAAKAATAYSEKSMVTAYDLAPATQLTEHFTLREFTLSATAIRHGIDNTPTDTEVERIKALCENVLEPLRRRFGVIRITSGYRSERVNQLVGGATFSQHRCGEAADIHVSSLEVAHKMCDFIREHLVFDQLILESVKKTGARWIHVSYRTVCNRHEYFTLRK